MNNIESLKHEIMKYLLIICLGIIVITSCTNKNDKSDAYGNFEVKEVIISAEVQGKILQLSVEEGQEVSENKTIGLIDTIPLFLQKLVATPPGCKVFTVILVLSKRLANS